MIKFILYILITLCMVSPAQSAFFFQEMLSGQPQDTDQIAVYLSGTTTLLTGLTDINGSSISNPFTVADAGGSGQWGFVNPDRSIYDVYWVDSSDYIAKHEYDTDQLNSRGYFNYIKLDTTAGAPADTSTGVMYWDSDDAALSVIINGSILQVGQEFYIRVVNKTGGTLSDGTLVAISGAQGNRPTAAPVDVSSESSVRQYIGPLTGDVLDNAEGLATITGLVRDIDTSAWIAGTQVWATGALGAMTGTEPETGHRIKAGMVTVQHATQGVILALPKVYEHPKTIDDALNAANSPTSLNPFVVADDLHYMVVLNPFIASPARNVEQNIHGGLFPLSTADDLSAGTVSVTNGIGKVIIVLNAGTDFVGTITVTGTQVDRNSGVETPGATSVITVDTLTTDTSSIDANGIDDHNLVNAYITDKWYSGAITITSADTVITDIDTYNVAYEQFNDSTEIEILSVDLTLLCLSSTSAKLSAYLYTVAVTGDKVDVVPQHSVVESTFVAGLPYRFRYQPVTPLMIDGTTDGIFVTLGILGNNTFADVGHKLWAELKHEE